MATEATMVRNAGGRAFDAIRTLSVLQTIGDPRTIIVMHHTGELVIAELACVACVPRWPNAGSINADFRMQIVV
jgi:hypothetical protein